MVYSELASNSLVYYCTRCQLLPISYNLGTFQILRVHHITSALNTPSQAGCPSPSGPGSSISWFMCQVIVELQVGGGRVFWFYNTNISNLLKILGNYCENLQILWKSPFFDIFAKFGDFDENLQIWESHNLKRSLFFIIEWL